MNSLKIPKQANRISYMVHWGEHTPEFPERTSMRATKEGIEYCQWHTRNAMLKACNMQPKTVKGSTQWKPFKAKEEIK